MAQAIGSFIDRIQLGDDDAHQIAIGSSAYGICNTAASTVIKVVNIPGFTLNTGTTIHVKFTYANSANDPKLKFNDESDTNAKAIMQYGDTAIGTTAETTGWQAGAVLTLTYDGTNWIRDQGYNTNTTSSNNKVRQSILTTSNNYSLLFSYYTATAASSTTAQYAYRSNDIYGNPVTGLVHATLFDGSGANLTNLNGSNISSGLVPVAYGGTGVSSFTDNCVIIPSTTDSIQQLISSGLKITGTQGNNITLEPDTASKTMTIKSSTGAMTIATTSGALAIQTTSGNISLSSGGTVSIDSGSSKTISINSGSTLTFNSATNTAIEFQKNSTTAWSFSADGTNISPSTTNTINLGTSTYRWASLEVGTASTYGDAYQPIYWNNGVPNAITIVQKIPFTLGSLKKSVTISTSTNNIITSNSIVMDIVITSGADYLNAPLTWKSITNSIVINTAVATSGSISGYILVIRGAEIADTNFTYTQGTSEV